MIKLTHMRKRRSQKVLGIIPARLESTRLPRKLLEEINGQPLIYHTWRRALAARTLDHVLIAADSKIIFDICRGFGADVLMTRGKIECGSDRVAVAAKLFKRFKPSIVVNIQGDEPLMPAEAIDQCVEALVRDKIAVVATPATYFFEPTDVDSPSFVKVVSDKRDHALYFSRHKIPYPRGKFSDYWKHLGLYVFRAYFLQKYVTLPPTPLELAEKLEQLRILENGFKIKIVKGNFHNMEVNTLEELERARAMLAQASFSAIKR